MITEIKDFNASELDIFARLTEVQLRSHLEKSKGIFIAESATAVNLALNAEYEPISLLIEKKQLDRDGLPIMNRVPDVPVYTAEGTLLERLTGYKLTRGILCAMRRKPFKTAEELLTNAKRVAVLEDITDSTNIGAIFRSAAALGIDAVIASHGCADPYCRRAIRVSMGTIFQIPWTVFGENNIDWHNDGIDFLHRQGFVAAAMALSGNSVSISDKRLREAEKLALIFGTEGSGLAQGTIEKSDFNVKIPMSNGVDSLNVAAASAVAFWQMKNQQ